MLQEPGRRVAPAASVVARQRNLWDDAVVERRWHADEGPLLVRASAVDLLDELVRRKSVEEHPHGVRVVGDDSCEPLADGGMAEAPNGVAAAVGRLLQERAVGGGKRVQHL